MSDILFWGNTSGVVAALMVYLVSDMKGPGDSYIDPELHDEPTCDPPGALWPGNKGLTDFVYTNFFYNQIQFLKEGRDTANYQMPPNRRNPPNQRYEQKIPVRVGFSIVGDSAPRRWYGRCRTDFYNLNTRMRVTVIGDGGNTRAGQGNMSDSGWHYMSALDRATETLLLFWKKHSYIPTLLNPREYYRPNLGRWPSLTAKYENVRIRQLTSPTYEGSTPDTRQIYSWDYAITYDSTDAWRTQSGNLIK